MSMITATAWVPRGYAAEFPTKYAVDDEELARISKLAKLQLEDAKEDFDAAQREKASDTDGDDAMNEDEGVKVAPSKAEADDDLREYDLDHYDDDETQDTVTLSRLGNSKALAYHENNADDPYLTAQDEEEEEEREALQILGTDNMILAARVEDEIAHLEAYVYEDEADNIYVHHDIMLPAIPLCVSWLDIPVGKTQAGGPVDQNTKGNYIAVGTFEPDIELWDLDVVDCMYPNAILGPGGQEENEVQAGKKKKKKKKKSKKANDDYHVDAVLSLAANRNHRTLLASSSADKTIKLWDLKTLKCAKSYSHHTDKVCSIEWSPRDTTVLLSGSYDRTAVVADMRAPNATAPRWGVESDVECVRWNPHDPNHFFITTESGMLHYHDLRQAPSSPASSKPLWQLQAHDESVSSFDINPTVPGFLATGSSDKEVKLWSVQSAGPSMVVSRNLGVGKVFSTTFGPDPEVAFRLVVAGSKGAVQIWDTSTNSAVRRNFASRIKSSNEPVKERLVGLNHDGESEESDTDEDQEDAEDKDGWESMEED